MAFDILPVEILDKIFGYSELDSISLVSKKMHSIATRTILSKMKINYPGEKFQQISSFVNRTQMNHLVRRLVLEISPAKDLAELLSFVASLPALRFLDCDIYVAHEIVQRRKETSRLELSVHGFVLCSDFSDKLKNSDANLLETNYITSIHCCVYLDDLFEPEDNDMDDNEYMDSQVDYMQLREQADCRHMIKAVSFIADHCPHLRRLELRKDHNNSFVELPPCMTSTQLRLKSLHLVGLGKVEPMFFDALSKIIDFTCLECLTIPPQSPQSGAWLWQNVSLFRQLSQLRVEVEPYLECGSYASTTDFMLSLPPLRQLGMLHYPIESFPIDILENHCILEDLILRPLVPHGSPDRVASVYSWTKMDFSLLGNLNSLDIILFTLPHQAAELFKVLRQLRLDSLVLTLYFSTNDTEPPNDRATAELFRYIAIDDNLASWIYKFCMLEYLKVTFLPSCHLLPNEDESNAKDCILDELSGSYIVKKIEGHVRATKLVARSNAFERDNFRLFSDVMAIFHTIWPSKGGDWRDDWSSLPMGYTST